MHTPGNQGKKSQTSLFWTLFLCSTLTVTGCATTSDPSKVSASAMNPADPYENFNRTMYGFNLGVDKYLLKPIADGYKTVTPDFMQTGVTNFFNNLKGINVALNDLLQGKLEQSAMDFGRFTTNSTIGLLGLFDIASELGLPQNTEDFGQTLAVWGVDQGPYLVLPVFGPTTARDGSAIIVDKAANPGTYLPGTGIIEGINERANAEGALNFIDEAALDPYVFTRESFLQYRNNLINDGKTDINSFDLDIDEVLREDSETATIPKKAASKKKNSSTAAVNNETSSKSGNHISETDIATINAFESMSRSFDDALVQFEQASAKLDKINQRKRRYRRRW